MKESEFFLIVNVITLVLWWITARSEEEQKREEVKTKCKEVNIIKDRGESRGEALIPRSSNLPANEWFRDCSHCCWPFQSSEDKL